MEGLDWRKSFAVVACGLSIVGSLGVYGVLQERILAFPYDDGAYFASSAFLVLSNRLFGMVFAALLMLGVTTTDTVRERRGEKPAVEQKATALDYFLVSASNVAATGCQYEAVKYLCYSVQMVGKATKVLPVMYWGTLVARKTYSRTEWALALAVTAGCALFLLGGDLASHKKQVGPKTEVWGLMYLGLSLLCDGFTSTYQEQLFRRRVSLSSQMLYTNLCSALIATAVLLVQGDLYESVAFARHHPDFCHDVIILSLAAAAAQVCIYSTISWYGAVALAAMINVRQCVSILLSNTLYHHALSALQVAGCALMFSSLGVAHFQRRPRSPAEQAPLLPPKGSP